MSRNDSALAPARESAPRILAFCWAAPSVVDGCLNLAAELFRRGRAAVTFVTQDPYGKLLLLQRGAEAFTIGELCALSQDQPAPEIPEPELDRLGAFDRLWGYQWLPAKISPFPRPDQLSEYYRWSSRRIISAFSFLLDALQPQAVLTWNGASFLTQAPVYLAAERGIPRFFLERGLLPDTLIVDPEGVNYGSLLAGKGWRQLQLPDLSVPELQAVEHYCRDLQRQGRTIVPAGQTLSPEDARRKLGIPPGARIVLFPLQMERDSNIISYSPHYRQMPAIIRDLARAVQDLPDVCLIVKPHPEDRDRLAELRSFGSARVRLSEDLSLPSLLAIADVVVTVNSTVGLEALTRRKPVLVLGQAIYGEKGFTFDLESPARLPERLRESLAAAQNGRFNEAAFHRFLAYLLTHSLFRLNGPDPWGSRDHISQRILSAAASTRGAAPPHSPKLETLRTKNRELLAWLPGPKAGASGPSSLFLLSPQAEVAEFLPRILPQTRVETLDRSNVGRRLVPSLSRSYDAALSFGYPAYPRRVVWALVRARQKFHLC